MLIFIILFMHISCSESAEQEMQKANMPPRELSGFSGLSIPSELSARSNKESYDASSIPSEIPKENNNISQSGQIEKEISNQDQSQNYKLSQNNKNITCKCCKCINNEKSLVCYILSKVKIKCFCIDNIKYCIQLYITSIIDYDKITRACDRTCKCTIACCLIDQ